MLVDEILGGDHIAQGREIVFRAVYKRSAIAAGCSKPSVRVPWNKCVDFARLQVAQPDFRALSDKIELDAFCCFHYLRKPMGKSPEWDRYSLAIEFLDRGDR